MHAWLIHFIRAEDRLTWGHSWRWRCSEVWRSGCCGRWWRSSVPRPSPHVWTTCDSTLWWPDLSPVLQKKQRKKKPVADLVKEQRDTSRPRLLRKLPWCTETYVDDERIADGRRRRRGRGGKEFSLSGPGVRSPSALPPWSRRINEISGYLNEVHGSVRAVLRQWVFICDIHSLVKILQYLVSRKMSLKSRLARNMNMLLWSFISVMPLGGREWPTATRPTVWKQDSYRATSTMNWRTFR